MKKDIVEKYLGQKVEIKLFDGEIVRGEFHKTREERYKNNPNLSIPKNYYFVEFDFNNHSYLFRSSHIKKIILLI